MTSRAFSYCDDLANLPPSLRGAAVAIGNFDGFHRGHQHVFEHLKAVARSLNVPAVIMSFEPHPRDFFARTEPLLRLSSPATKRRVAKAIGVDGLVILKFDDVLSQIDPIEFVERILIQQLGCRAVIVGENFRFGRTRAGDIDFLRQEGLSRGFAVGSLSLVEDGGHAISSTRIRHSLASGDMSSANSLLGYHWFLESRLNGLGDGNSIEFPQLKIPQGVYAIRGDCRAWPVEGMALICPSYPGRAETHWLEELPRLPEASVTLAFVDRVTDDCAMESPANLHSLVRSRLARIRHITPLDRSLGVV